MLGIVYLEAIRRMMQNGTKLKRTVHVVFVPDEEVDGRLGMKLFVQTKAFKELNVGVALDEASVNPDNDTIYVFNNERVRWAITVNCTGDAGHASRLINDTAAEKLRIVLEKFSDLRKHYANESGEFLTLGKTVTINLTVLKVPGS